MLNVLDFDESAFVAFVPFVVARAATSCPLRVYMTIGGTCSPRRVGEVVVGLPEWRPSDAVLSKSKWDATFTWVALRTSGIQELRG